MSWGVATQNGVSVSLASIVSLSAGVTEFSPADLFTGGVAGAWYDPSDYSTLFQDSAGTTPVTAVEQPVGLMLDKSQGLVLGSEVVTNGDFATDTWWTKSPGVTISGGECSFSSVSQGTGVYKDGILTIGRWYLVTYTIKSISSGAVRIWTTGVIRNSSGTFTEYYQATTANFGILGNSNTPTATAVIDNVSVRELPGNHASQATAASRPVLRARYNLLTYSEQFDNAAWSKTQTTVSANAVTAPDGTNTADKLVETTAPTTVHYAYQTPTLAAGTHTFRVYLKAAERSWAMINVFRGTTYSAFVNLSTGAVGNSAGGVSVTATSLANSWWQFDMTFTVATAGSSDMGVRTATANGVEVYTGDGTSGIYIWGADLRTGSSAGTYQRIAAATDYATAGFLPYLALDGTDDSLATGSINFTATDKMSVVTGITKLSDAATAILVELSTNSNSNSGVVMLTAPLSASERYSWVSKGTAITSILTTSSSYNAPVTNVITGLGDISGDLSTLRINATQIAQTTADQGTGNFGNYPLFIGRRGGATLPFNGRIYQMVVCGKALSASELAALESFTNSKTGAY